MPVSNLAAPLETLTLSQLFIRQAQAGNDHERALTARNQHPTISAEWDLWNAVLTGNMQDLADIAAEIGRRIDDMRAEAEHGPLTLTPMACAECGQPVRSLGMDGGWVHKADGTPATAARVDA